MEANEAELGELLRVVGVKKAAHHVAMCALTSGRIKPRAIAKTLRFNRRLHLIYCEMSYYLSEGLFV